jgi:DNA modification methylase
MNVDNLRLAKDMKYEALYWALGFEELNKGIFTKVYNKNLKVEINADKQQVDLGNKISIVNGETLLLTTHKSFVILECIDKLLTMGYKPSEIIIDLDNEYDIYCKDLYIKCYEWNHLEEDKVEFKKDIFKSISYESRLISGVIERRTSIKTADGSIYNHGIFESESRLDNYNLYNSNDIISDDFIVKAGVATKYTGNKSIVVVPEGVTELAPCLFWDNQVIEEVILPDTLVNISGDTFYNSASLKKVNIPKNVKFMGNNPFAGCPNIEVINESPYFNLVDGILYNRDFTRLIYYPISKKDDRYEIKEGCRILGKHSFYLCDNLKEVVIPSSIIKLENNPFSGCNQITLNNKSSYYHVEDSVIYDRDYSSVIGCLNSIDTDCLVLKDVKRICRNSFWNCKGIRKIVFPKTLEDIGYNPFVSCSNIEFESNSDKYIVYNNALFTADKSKLVCYPAKYAIGEVHLPDETITLERGAFSGCDKLSNIHLHNVSIISKTCFTNCNSLVSVYCSDIVTYIGEWAFAHCANLKEVSVYKDCFIDNNATLNSPVNIIRRENLSNYVIESDNLFTLKSMTKSYKSKIKSILIDPPYNSHIDYIGYQDAFDGSYNNFMLSRIELAYELLSNDGFLVINIDEGEVENLAKLCKDLFYKVKVCKWEKLHPYFDKNRNVNPNKKVVKYEYIIICFKSKESKLNNLNQPYLERDVLKEKEAKVPNIFKCFGTNSSAKDEIAAIFGDRTYFQTPKPLKLLKELVRATTNKDSTVLDFFAGSGTTGHAVIDLNKEDGGNRKYILISNSESNICKDVTLKRIKMFDSNVKFIN